MMFFLFRVSATAAHEGLGAVGEGFGVAREQEREPRLVGVALGRHDDGVARREGAGVDDGLARRAEGEAGGEQGRLAVRAAQQAGRFGVEARGLDRLVGAFDASVVELLQQLVERALDVRVGVERSREYRLQQRGLQDVWRTDDVTPTHERDCAEQGLVWTYK